jgi:hypothetical protein
MIIVIRFDYKDLIENLNNLYTSKPIKLNKSNKSKYKNYIKLLTEKIKKEKYEAQFTKNIFQRDHLPSLKIENKYTIEKNRNYTKQKNITSYLDLIQSTKENLTGRNNTCFTQFPHDTNSSLKNGTIQRWGFSKKIKNMYFNTEKTPLEKIKDANFSTSTMKIQVCKNIECKVYGKPDCVRVRNGIHTCICCGTQGEKVQGRSYMNMGKKK